MHPRSRGFRLPPRILAPALLIAWVGLWSVGVPFAGAQMIECTDQPLLATFDANDDGVLSVVEIRQADPDDVELQEYADELEAAGVIGVFYQGCDDLEDDAVGEETGGDAGADNGDPSGEDDEAPLVVTTLPGVGHGISQGTDASAGGSRSVLASTAAAFAVATLIGAIAASRPAAIGVRTRPAGAL